jgi:hypothetical protein
MPGTTAAGRWFRVAGYALLALAGCAAVAWPTPSVRAAAAPTAGALVYVWAAMLIVGGLASAVGAARDRWLGEYAGLWPLIMTWAVYALAALATGRPTAIASAAALGGVALILLARWRVVASIRREAARYHAEHEDR